MIEFRYYAIKENFVEAHNIVVDEMKMDIGEIADSHNLLVDAAGKGIHSLEETADY